MPLFHLFKFLGQIRISPAFVCGAMAVGLVAGLVGCSPGPDYKRTDLALSPVQDPDRTYENAPTQFDKNHISNQAPEMSHWWRHIGDADLRRDINILVKENLDLKQAFARMEQAREQVKVTAGLWYPSVGVNASRNRSFRPAEEFSTIFGGGGPAPSGGGVNRVFDTQIEGSASASWQLDLFGQIRTRVQSQEALFAAQELDKEALLHSLVAELVRHRIALAALEMQRDLAHQIAENRQQILKLTQSRYDNGAAGIQSADIHRARQILASVQSDIPEIEQALKERHYAVDILLGRSPSYDDQSYKALDLALLPPDMPIGLPAHLLDRRPDVRSAEFRLISGHHDIGAAIADLYPNLTLDGTIGFEDESTNGLFNAERLIGSLLARASATIFEGGALRARIRLEEAEKKELAANYAKVILVAMQEAETALAKEGKSTQRLELARQERQAAGARFVAARKRYEGGISLLAEYLEEELDAHRAALTHLARWEERWQTRIDLYLALGGDWFAPIKAPAVPSTQLADVQMGNKK